MPYPDQSYNSYLERIRFSIRNNCKTITEISEPQTSIYLFKNTLISGIVVYDFSFNKYEISGIYDSNNSLIDVSGTILSQGIQMNLTPSQITNIQTIYVNYAVPVYSSIFISDYDLNDLQSALLKIVVYTSIPITQRQLGTFSTNIINYIIGEVQLNIMNITRSLSKSITISAAQFFTFPEIIFLNTVSLITPVLQEFGTRVDDSITVIATMKPPSGTYYTSKMVYSTMIP